MRKLIGLVILGLILTSGKIGETKDSPEVKVMIVDLKSMAIETVFNPSTKRFEGSFQEKFLVVATAGGPDKPKGNVKITRIVEPVGLPKSSLTATLSRNDFSGPVTEIILTGRVFVPLTVPAGTYSGGLIEITVLNEF